MITLKPTTRTMTILAIIAVFFCIGGAMVYLMGSKHLSREKSALASKQKQVDESKKIAGRLTKAEEGYLKAQAELGFLETSISTHTYIPTLLGQLERLGKSHNLKVVSVRPQQAPPQAPPPIKRTSQDPESADTASKTDKTKADQPENKPYEELKIDIELEGKYWHVHNFLYSLTRFPKIIAVKEIQMAPIRIAEKRGSPILQVKLVLTAFVFKEVNPSINTSPADTKRATVPSGRLNNEG